MEAELRNDWQLTHASIKGTAPMKPKQNNPPVCPEAQITLSMLLLLACAALGMSCRKVETTAPVPAAELRSNVVAVVAGVEISADALRAELRRQFRVVPEDGLKVEQKLTALETLVRSEAIYAQAQAQGFDRTSEMQARIKQMVVAQFKERQFKPDRKSTRLNSSHLGISYAVFCLKKKKKQTQRQIL